MNTYTSTASLVLLCSLAGAANANGLVPGQHHLIPQGQDRQHITLVGKKSEACAGNGMALHLVDEWGTTAAATFKVPSLTVFLLTDVNFVGHNPSGYKGIPTLSISTGDSDTSRAVFSTAPLAGVAQEQFAGNNSLISGVAYPVNSTFCAYASATWSNGGASLNLTRVVVQGTVMTNYKTSGFNW